MHLKLRIPLHAVKNSMIKAGIKFSELEPYLGISSSNNNIIFSVTTHKNTKFDDYILVLDQLKQANATKISIANPPGF